MKKQTFYKVLRVGYDERRLSAWLGTDSSTRKYAKVYKQNQWNRFPKNRPGFVFGSLAEAERWMCHIQKSTLDNFEIWEVEVLKPQANPMMIYSCRWILCEFLGSYPNLTYAEYVECSGRISYLQPAPDGTYTTTGIKLLKKVGDYPSTRLNY